MKVVGIRTFKLIVMVFVSILLSCVINLSCRTVMPSVSGATLPVLEKRSLTFYPNQDTPRIRRLTAEEAAFKKSILDLVRNANQSFKDVREVSMDVREIKRKVTAYDTLLPKILDQNVKLFNIARTRRIEKESAENQRDSALILLQKVLPQLDTLKTDQRTSLKEERDFRSAKKELKAYTTTFDYTFWGAFGTMILIQLITLLVSLYKKDNRIQKVAIL